MKYFWINLENSVSRRINLLKEFADNNITEHYRVNAYLGVDDTKRAKESACCRSHLQALTHFLLNHVLDYKIDQPTLAKNSVIYF